ncbi:hypothetical protein AAVH_03783 [Aphelenchoides avenae]|nr:hypothetical protein AAVH_03783 [Aphelenchus avenae]
MPATIINCVWEHFDVFDDKSFTCNVDDCGQHFNPPLRSTTAMRHLARKHPDVHIIVFFMEQARKQGTKTEEPSADENEPNAKKSRSESISDNEALPVTTHNSTAEDKDTWQEKATSSIEQKVTPARSLVAKQVDKSTPRKAMPKEAPETSKEAMLAHEVCKTTPPVAEQPTGFATRVKRKAAIEAGKRIAHLNEWLHQVRKEQKEVRAKRTAVLLDTNVDEENDDAEWPVDFILDERWVEGKRHLLLRWTGYGASADTWEPLEHLAGAAELLAAFDAAMDDGFNEELLDDE